MSYAHTQRGVIESLSTPVEDEPLPGTLEAMLHALRRYVDLRDEDAWETFEAAALARDRKHAAAAAKDIKHESIDAWLASDEAVERLAAAMERAPYPDRRISFSSNKVWHRERARAILARVREQSFTGDEVLRAEQHV